MSHQPQDKVIALAAITQVAANVSTIAQHNQFDQTQLLTAIKSIAVDNPANTLEVFGDISQLKTGLELLIRNFTAKRVNPDIGRYLVNLTTLERQLVKSPEIFKQLGNRIEASKRQLEFYPIDSPEILKIYAGIYRDTISKLPLKIQVVGKQEYLQQEVNQDRVRALLLAGVRAAVLWRQVGGKRRQILFQRKALVKHAEQLIQQMTP